MTHHIIPFPVQILQNSYSYSICFDIKLITIHLESNTTLVIDCLLCLKKYFN